MRTRWLLSYFMLLLVAVPSRAELPRPRLDRITPFGGKTGSVVQVQISADSVEDAKRLWFEHPGIKAEWVKDRTFNVTIGNDVPDGTYDARVLGKFGLTNPRLFAVQRHFTETIEKEPNDEPPQAYEVPLNTVVNGNSDGNRDDWFLIKLTAGQRVLVSCIAQRLESSLDATLVLTDANGKQIASNSDYHGRDPQLEVIAPATGTYFIKLTDLTYRGGLPYRLLVTDQSTIETVFPRVVPIGQPATLTAFGRNFRQDGKTSVQLLAGLPVEEKPYQLKADADRLSGYRFAHHPLAHSVLPTGATVTLVGLQHEELPPLMTTSLPIVHDREPNDDRDKPQVVPIPVCVAGRFDQSRDADWFEFESVTAGKYTIEVYCERLAGQADPYIVLYDAKGNRMQEADDFGIRTNAFDAHVRDPQLNIDLQAKTKYRLLVQDRYRRGGLRYQYVLTVQAAKPDFFPAAIHSENPNPTGFNIPKGGAYHLDVIVHQSGGFSGSIVVQAEQLPKGVHATPTTITNDIRGTLVLWADADAPDYLGPIKLVATGTMGDNTIQREVRAYTRPGGQNEMAGSRPTREPIISVQTSAPYSLQFQKEQITVEAGSKAEIKLLAERRWPEFKGTITVIPNSTFGSIKLGQVSIAEGKADASVTIDVAANARPGAYTVAMLGQAQVPFSKDDKPKTNTLVTQTSRPITVIVAPKPMKK